jgi:hypothetical protein
MADSIKIGNLDISAFKVGSSDCKIYLGGTLLYPQSQPPTPTGYTYSVTIQGLENGDTTTISWFGGIHIDYNVENGTYTYTTTANTIPVDIDRVANYDLDYSHFDLYSGGSQTVTFTYQGGGGGLVNIPQGTNMEQYYGRTITRFKIDNPSLPSGFQMLNFGFQKGGGSGQIASWGTNFTFDSTLVRSLPCDVSGSDELTSWVCFDSSWAASPINPFTDLWIEWA